MFDLTMHSTHFIYGYMASEKKKKKPEGEKIQSISMTVVANRSQTDRVSNGPTVFARDFQEFNILSCSSV